MCASRGCLCCEYETPKKGPRQCPLCRHFFQGTGWDGVDAHWRAKHQKLMRYEDFWQSLCVAHKNPGSDVVESLLVGREAYAITARIEEPKYHLSQVISMQRASPAAVALLVETVNRIDARLRANGKGVVFRTHVRGVTAFCNTTKGFMFINLRQDYITALYFTGMETIPGLVKANWLNGNDNAGSETFSVTDSSWIKTAVDFACASYAIAAKAGAGKSLLCPSPTLVELESALQRPSTRDQLLPAEQRSPAALTQSRTPLPAKETESGFDPNDLKI